MSIAAKWTDLVVGTCLHPVVIPPAVPAVFPQIYIGLIHDVLGELMAPAIAWVFGSPPAGPVIINGLPAATTGQDGTNLVICPHLVPLPPGAAWGCVPTGDADLLWGSETVYIRGGRAVRLGDLAMTDSDPVALPLGLVFAVPHGKPVVIGGPQAIDAIAAAASLAASAAAAVARRALRALRDSSRGNRGARALEREAASEGAESAAQRATTAASRNARDQAPPGRVARRGDPVDVATGRVLAGKTDWELPGPIPLSFRREYSSSLSWRRLSLGYGWSHSFEQAVWLGLGKIVYRSEDGRELEYNTFNRAGDVLHPGDAIVDAANGWTLRCTGAFRFEVETHDGLIREFAPLTDSYRSGELPVSRLRRIWTRDGNAVRFVYDVRTGVLATVYDSAGRRVLFEHDEAGNLRRVLLPDPRTENAHRERFRYEQSTEGDLAAVMDARGRPFRYVYSGHLLVQTTDRNGMSFYWAYLGHGPTAWCRQSWGDGGLLNTTFVYDKVQRFTFVTDSNGAWKKYFWNEDGLVVRIMDGYRGEERFEHDERGLLIAFIDRAGRTTKATYDFYGSLTSITQPDGGVHQFEYRDRQLVRRIDPLGAIFELHRDEAGRVVELVDPLGARTRHEWAGGLLRATIEPGGRRTELEYDEEKNLVLGRTPDGVEHRAKYDRLGRMIERRNPREARLPAGGRLPIREEWVWDVTGLLDSCQALDGTRSALTWDAEGRLLSERTLSRETRYAYAGPGWLVSREEVTERGEPAAIVKLGYDREGQLVEVRNENDETWQMGYDARGDLVFERLYDGGLRRLRRNRKTGDLDEILEPSASTRQWNPRRNRWQYNVALAGRRTRHTQDAAGRLTRLDHSDGTFTAWSFDRAGRLASVQNAAGEVVFDRDLSGRVGDAPTDVENVA